MSTRLLSRSLLAAMLGAGLATQAHAADLTIVSVNQSVSIVDVPKSINLSGSSTQLGGATTTVSSGGFSGTLTSSYANAGINGVFDPQFSFNIPITAGESADTLMIAKSTVLFTANINHNLKPLSQGVGQKVVPGFELIKSNAFIVSELVDLTSGTVLFRIDTSTVNSGPTPAALLLGPPVAYDIFAAAADDAVFLRQGRQYSFTFAAAGTGKFDIPSNFLLPFNNLVGSASHSARFDVTAVTAVPEPGAYALMLAGLGFVGFMAKRRKAH